MYFKASRHVLFFLLIIKISHWDKNFTGSSYMIKTITNKSSHSYSIEKGVLKHFVKFTGKQLYQRSLFNKVVGLSPATLLKRRLWCRCFSVNFTKFLRAAFLQNHSCRLLLWKGDDMLFLSVLHEQTISSFLHLSWESPSIFSVLCLVSTVFKYTLWNITEYFILCIFFLRCICYQAWFGDHKSMDIRFNDITKTTNLIFYWTNICMTRR